ncbi:UDP-glucose 4-epimerase GalE [Viridibacillus sp. YIM B01967]|uniref:UDP-glucose 4-epimerase n=1 Tax=Viridibacillus soli TaxID=2798301 RepID=A0ABS1HCI3_9BACL|nr:UDP-glucose 4-epimerase GalE [Viridibacillus soli]MBK3497117.1 UDP-glucose 4-epimerase GalE [Viridibacillus soli]
MTILVIGGTGYIGSHTIVELLNRGEECIILDNLSNSQMDVIDSIQKITSRKVFFIEGDVMNEACLKNIFYEHDVDAVIYLVDVQSTQQSYEANLKGAINILRAMKKVNVKRFIYGSTAKVYHNDAEMSATEDSSLSAINPYVRSKLLIEDMLRDLASEDPSWSIIILRYFNPIGAHPSGLIREVPNGIPNKLMPNITQVATDQSTQLNVFGNDYNTVDGTGVRDYIHVCDLAEGHAQAISYLIKNKGCHEFNLGTGKGTSVLELVAAFEKANGIPNYS